MRTFVQCLMFALLCSAGLAASTPDNYCVDVWNTEQGLPQSSVITLTQSRDGYLWLGTVNGLVRFDGARFTVFDESNTQGLGSSKIIKVFEDSAANLWLGTETAGVALVRNGHVASLDIGRGRREGRLMSICEDASGAVWLYTEEGELARHFNGQIDVWKTKPAGLFNFCRAVIAEKDGLVWVGNDHLLFAIDPKTVISGAPPKIQDETEMGHLDYLLACRAGGHWRMADGSIQKWNGNKLESTLAAYPWPAGMRVSGACEDTAANLVVGTREQGVFWFDSAGGARHISKSNGLSSDTVLSVFADNEGGLWVGTDGLGLNRIRRAIFKTLEHTAGWTVQSLCEDEKGGLWFSSNDDGIDYCKDNALKNVRCQFGPMNRFNVRAVLRDHENHIWVGTIGYGLFELQDGVFQPVGAGIVGEQISALHEDRAGRLWIGSQSGLMCWDGHQWASYTAGNGLSANIVRAIADDAAGNLWIGTERGGLNRLRDGKFTVFAQTNGFPSDNISSLLADDHGVLWVGTFGSGLIRMKDDQWTQYTDRNGLVANSVDYMIEDGRGFLWIGSNKALMRAPIKALADFAAGMADFIPCRAFGKHDGLPSGECTFDSQPACCRAASGTLFFPTIAGAVSVDPDRISIDTHPPQVMIESVAVDGKEQNTNGLHTLPPQKIVLPPGREQLDIQYACLNFDAPNWTRFKYRLEGFETAWRSVENSRVVHYSKLPPGDYSFVVTACNQDGVWNPSGAILEVLVLPPFWRAWWFLSAMTIAALGIIIGAVHFISTQKLQRQLEGLRQREALEKERARIARDIHDQVGASLTQVSLLGELVETDKDHPDEVAAHALQISQTARETTRALDEIVWTVNPSNDTLEGLVNYICKHAQEFLAVAGLRYRLDAPPQLPALPISPEARHNVFLAAKESITNVVRHAHATEVWVRLRIESRQFTLEIEDNGRGPAGMNEKSGRNGLRNMRKRLEDIGGRFTIEPVLSGGTVARMVVPIK